MHIWYAKAAVLLGSIVMVVIRAPHGRRSRSVPVAESRKGSLEILLLIGAWIGFFIPLIWIISPAFSFADYPLRPAPFAAGIACYVIGLWLFYRSHADLGTNWSITLELREQHQLVTHGIYRYIRHPMYSSLFLYSLGQLLAVPNWIAGPCYLVSFGLLFVCRVGAEERMMRDRFGDAYDKYKAATKRVIPGVW